MDLKPNYVPTLVSFILICYICLKENELMYYLIFEFDFNVLDLIFEFIYFFVSIKHSNLILLVNSMFKFFCPN